MSSKNNIFNSYENYMKDRIICLILELPEAKIDYIIEKAKNEWIIMYMRERVFCLTGKDAYQYDENYNYELVTIAAEKWNTFTEKDKKEFEKEFNENFKI